LASAEKNSASYLFTHRVRPSVCNKICWCMYMTKQDFHFFSLQLFTYVVHKLPSDFQAVNCSTFPFNLTYFDFMSLSFSGSPFSSTPKYARKYLDGNAGSVSFLIKQIIYTVQIILSLSFDTYKTT